jgi:hypothetical protein
MKRLMSACVLLAALARGAGAQEPAGRVAGRVVDAQTGLPVAGATVLAGADTVLTDARGGFTLPAAPPRAVRVAKPGYESRDTTLAAGGPVEIRVRARAVALAGITVTARRAAQATAPHYELSPVGIARVPPLAEPDILRAVSTLPGIEQPNGWKSAFHVRGGASDETLIVLDGMPLQAPYHMLGLFGGVQLGAVGGATMHLGAPPVHFDDRLSGIIDIRTVVPDSAFFQGHLSVLSTGAVAGRRWGGGSLLLGGRYATTELIGAAVGAGRYGFADGNLRLRQELAKGWTLDASGFTSGDWIGEGFGSGDREEEAAQSAFRPDYRWGNRTGRLGLIRQGGAGWLARADVTYSGFGIRFRELPRVPGADSARDVIDARSGLLKAAAGVELPVGEHRVSAGAELQSERFDHRWRGAFEEFSENTPTTYEYAARQNRWAAYLADHWTPTERFELTLGLRALHVAEAAAPGPYLAPRAAVRWRPASGVELFGSAGRLYQTTTHAEEAREGDITSPRFALEERPNAADAAEIGAEWELPFRTRVRLTGFAKEYRRVARLDPSSALLYPSAPYPGLRFGTGGSRGIEALVSHAGERFDTQLSYTFARTRLEMEGTEAPPDWDTPHSLKALASLSLGGGWRATTVGTLRSGLPYTPVLGTVLIPDGADAGRRMRRGYVRGPENSGRLPLAQRLDLGVERRGRVGSASYTLRLQVLNALNQGTLLRLNPSPYYDYGAGEGEPLDDSFDRSIPFLPSIGMEIHF